MRENHYATLVSYLKISYVFKLQDEHNASFFFNMSWKEFPLSKCKDRKNFWKQQVFRLFFYKKSIYRL